MDRNQLTGLLLIFLMLLIYFEFLAPKPEPIKPKNITQDTQKVKKSTQNKVELQAAKELPDSIKQAKYGLFASVLSGKAQTYTLENEHLKVQFSSQGAIIEQVQLKNYKTYQKQELLLLDKRNHAMSLQVPTSQTGLPQVDIYALYYSAQQKDNMLTFVADLGNNKRITHIYTLKKGSFEVDYQIKLHNTADIIDTKQKAQLSWKQDLRPFEHDIKQSRYAATINFYDKDANFDYLSETSLEPQEKKLSTNLHWFSFKQKFFNSALVAPNHNLQEAHLKQTTNEADTQIEKTAEVRLALPIADLSQNKGNFKFYFGPNRYYVLAGVADGFHKNVYLGIPVVNLVSRYLVIPVFAFFEQYTNNYGIVILLLMLVTRILIFPLAYKSYISMAKMKVLKPELDEIKARTGGDMQKMQIEQMDLYRQVGINPLSGCIPLLLQLPVLFALFTFLPNAIELRQRSLLWATDLSTYDSIMTLPFAIPFYGNHVSLFTILMTISTLLLTYANSQSQANMDANMKFMMYFMPVMLLFVLNTLPAGLNYYYFVSNIASIAQQYGMKFFINEAQIKQKLEENKLKNKDKKKSSFQAKLEESVKAAQEKASERKKQQGKK